MTRKHVIAFGVSAAFPLFGLAATVAGVAVLAKAGAVAVVRHLK
ncbi:MAG: hypothetical protein SYR96_09535 [Actinomycetota bacterium]|nr:hypothetical protein [Actinomycetota bacterium]